jgi:hypothetical protein
LAFSPGKITGDFLPPCTVVCLRVEVRAPPNYSNGSKNLKVLTFFFLRSIHFVFFFLFINHTIAFAMLWASVIRLSRSAQIGATLWVIGMSVIASTAWDSGNFFNTDTISTDLKTFITIWPIWGFYRGWGEYKEYAQQVRRILHRSIARLHCTFALSYVLLFILEIFDRLRALVQKGSNGVAYGMTQTAEWALFLSFSSSNGRFFY